MPQQAVADPIRVDVPTLGIVEFPAGTPEDTMKKAIDAQLAQSHVTKGEAVPHPIVQRMLEWMPAAGGVMGGILGAAVGAPELGIGAVPGAIAGAAVGGAAGRTVQNTLNAAIGNPAPKSVPEAFNSVGTAALGQAGSQAAGEAMAPAMRWAAPKLMQSAVKPTQALLQEYKTTAPRVVKTLLDEGVNVTNNGIAKLQTLLTATNDEIRSVVQGATGSVNKKTVAARALTTAKKVSNQVNPTADLKAVGDTVEEFLDHPIFKGNLSMPEAQAMKVGTYQQIGKKYGEVASASIETQKALARGLKEEIAAEVPGVQALNQRDSALMASLDAVGRRVAQAGNRDPVGFAWVTQHPTTFLAALLDRSPAIKSMLARGMYQSAATAAKVSPQLIRLAVQSVASTPDDTPDAPAPGPRRE